MSFHALADAVYPAAQHTRKPGSYLTLYDSLFAGLREAPVSLLELGVHGGHSLHLWHRFFPQAEITGLDMRPCPADMPDSRVAYVQGRQEEPRAIAEAARRGPFDIIIDDASHVGRLTKATWRLLFRDHLKAGGLYVLEDIAASTTLPDWPDYAPMTPMPDAGDRFPSYDIGMIGFVKQLVDQAATGRGEVAGVEIHPSVAVIRKRGERMD